MFKYQSRWCLAATAAAVLALPAAALAAPSNPKNTTTASGSCGAVTLITPNGSEFPVGPQFGAGIQIPMAFPSGHQIGLAAAPPAPHTLEVCEQTLGTVSVFTPPGQR